MGYVIGIALFIVLLPLIVLLGLFGWMAGDGGASLINYDVIYSQMPSEYREMIEEHQDELDMIEVTFIENGLSESDISKAKTIYISCLTGKEAEDLLLSRHVVTNKNMIEGDPSPSKSSGLRIGTAAATTRGLTYDQSIVLGRYIAKVLLNEEFESVATDIPKDFEKFYN